MWLTKKPLILCVWNKTANVKDWMIKQKIMEQNLNRTFIKDATKGDNNTSIKYWVHQSRPWREVMKLLKACQAVKILIGWLQYCLLILDLKSPYHIYPKICLPDSIMLRVRVRSSLIRVTLLELACLSIDL